MYTNSHVLPLPDHWDLTHLRHTVSLPGTRRSRGSSAPASKVWPPVTRKIEHTLIDTHHSGAVKKLSLFYSLPGRNPTGMSPYPYRLPLRVYEHGVDNRTPSRVQDTRDTVDPLKVPPTTNLRMRYEVQLRQWWANPRVVGLIIDI